MAGELIKVAQELADSFMAKPLGPSKRASGGKPEDYPSLDNSVSEYLALVGTEGILGILTDAAQNGTPFELSELSLPEGSATASELLGVLAKFMIVHQMTSDPEVEDRAWEQYFTFVDEQDEFNERSEGQAS